MVRDCTCCCLLLVQLVLGPGVSATAACVFVCLSTAAACVFEHGMCMHTILAARRCSILFVWLISHGRKYRWLICCERKTLLDG